MPTAPKPRPKPQAAIRRFDVFAEYNRLKARQDGMPAAQAKGHGLWLAKWVASRRFRTEKAEPKSEAEQRERRAAQAGGKWKTLSGEEQTDKRFDKEIVARMGRDFYRRVFAPAIRSAFERGASYESIRDSLRKDWKPEEE
jgi:hypothetical protein